MKTNYQTLNARLKSAQTKEEINRVEQTATKVYNAGQLSVSELKRIDVACMEKAAKIEG